MKFSLRFFFLQLSSIFLSSVHNNLENRNWNEKRTNIFIRVLAVVFAIIGATYMLFGLGQCISLVLYPNDPTFNELELDDQQQTTQEAHLFAVAFIPCCVTAIGAATGLWRHKKFGWYIAP